MAVRAVARVASRGPDAPVRESREPVLRRPGVPVPVQRTPGASADQDVTEMTLADLVKLVDQKKQGVREVVLDDPTDQDELSESSAPIVLSRGSQAGLAARMLRRR